MSAVNVVYSEKKEKKYFPSEFCEIVLKAAWEYIYKCIPTVCKYASLLYTSIQ